MGTRPAEPRMSLATFDWDDGAAAGPWPALGPAWWGRLGKFAG